VCVCVPAVRSRGKKGNQIGWKTRRLRLRENRTNERGEVLKLDGAAGSFHSAAPNAQRDYFNLAWKEPAERIFTIWYGFGKSSHYWRLRCRHHLSHQSLSLNHGLQNMYCARARLRIIQNASNGIFPLNGPPLHFSWLNSAGEHLSSSESTGGCVAGNYSLVLNYSRLAIDRVFMRITTRQELYFLPSGARRKHIPNIYKPINFMMYPLVIFKCEWNSYPAY